jgi:hypothetical protein
VVQVKLLRERERERDLRDEMIRIGES